MTRNNLISILKEGGKWSFTRIIAFTGFTVFLIASIYLIIKGQTWGNYDTFANLTGGGGAAVQVANKFINSKYNTPQGEVGKK